MIGLLLTVFISSHHDNMNTFNFNQLKQDQYMILNDGVMGGRSQSQLIKDEGAANFSGTVSLENNGGFASVRMIWPFISDDQATSATVLSLKVKGDGLRYQFRLRTNRGFDGAAYSYAFDTVKDQEQTVYIPVDQFVPTFRGRVLRDMPQLRFADVQQMGVLISDKQVGGFSIELYQVSLD